MRSSALLMATLLLVTGCGSSDPASDPTETVAASDSPSVAPAEPTESESPTASAAAVPALKSFGVASKQCQAMSGLLMTTSRIGLLANAGTPVTQNDVDQAFQETADVPKAAMPLVRKMKSVSQDLVGKSSSEVAASVGSFSEALDALTQASQTVCS